jgi:CGNR zinc finger protein
MAQRPDADRENSSPEIALRQFASSLAPRLLVDGDADFGGAPRTKHLVMVKRKRAGRSKPDQGSCIHCGSHVTWWDRQAQGFCALHEPAARQVDAEDEESDRLMPSLRAVTRAQGSASANDLPKNTDPAALLREILDGLKSFLNNSEWTFPPLKVVPTVTLGAEQKKPERIMMGSLRDVTLLGISDLLLQHGRKIRRCAARDCDRAFLAIRRQTFCSPRCAARERFERFRKRLGRAGFKERRRKYYEKLVHSSKGKARVVGHRKQGGKTK